MSDNLYLVSTINCYGMEVSKLYEGYDYDEAMRQYKAKVDEGCAVRVLECVPKGFRVLRLKFEDEKERRGHPAQTQLDELFDAMTTLKGGGL